MGVRLQEIFVDIQFTIRRNEGNDVLSGMPCYVDYAWKIISVSVSARKLLGEGVNGQSPC